MARLTSNRLGLSVPSRADSEVPEEVKTLINDLEARDHIFQKRSSDPGDGNPEDGDLPQGNAMMWVSDGSGTGSDNDVILAINNGGSINASVLMNASGTVQ